MERKVFIGTETVQGKKDVCVQRGSWDLVYAQQRYSDITAYTYSSSFFGKLIYIHEGEQQACVNEEHTKNIHQAEMSCWGGGSVV